MNSWRDMTENEIGIYVFYFACWSGLSDSMEIGETTIELMSLPTHVDLEITKIIYILNASSNTSLVIIRMFDSGKNIESDGKKDKKWLLTDRALRLILDRRHSSGFSY